MVVCLRWAIPISAVLWALILWPVLAAPVYLDVCLKITGTRAEARIALDTLSFGRLMLLRNEDGERRIITANHHIAVDLWQQPPILRIRFISPEARRKAQEQIIDADSFPAGLERVRCSATRKWAGD